MAYNIVFSFINIHSSHQKFVTLAFFIIILLLVLSSSVIEWVDVICIFKEITIFLLLTNLQPVELFYPFWE